MKKMMMAVGFVVMVAAPTARTSLTGTSARGLSTL